MPRSTFGAGLQAPGRRSLVGEEIDGQLVYHGIVEWSFRATDVLELLREAETPRSGAEATYATATPARSKTPRSNDVRIPLGPPLRFR